MKRKRISLPIIVVGLLIISSCATTGPPATEQEIKATEEELKKQAEIFRKEQEERINKVASALMKNLDQTNSPKIKFTLTDDQEVNAGATFGFVMITTGMMRFIKTDDELAVVLGHEIAHITKNHIAKSMAVDVPLMIIDIAMIVVDPNLYNLTSLITDALSKKFSREQEKEADYFGLQYAARTGYNPNGGVKIWERFAIEIPKSMTKNLWASHPSSPERVVKAKKTALELQEGKLQNC